MKNLENLKQELETVKLEERLEMVQIVPIIKEPELAADTNGCCTGNGNGAKLADPSAPLVNPIEINKFR